VTLGVLLGLELVLLGFLHDTTPWRWLLLLSLLPVAWFLRRQARHLQAMVIVFLNEAAQHWALIKLEPEPSGAPEPAPPVKAVGAVAPVPPTVTAAK
jgi:hypothetical protein